MDEIALEAPLRRALASDRVAQTPRPLSAVVVGATGLVGSALVRLLRADDRFGSVAVLSRRPTGVASPKLKEHVVDFEAAAWTGLLRGDVLFSALGTTLAAAGSKQAQHHVDHDHNLRIATAARKNGVPTYVLVSSAGASPRSVLFYSRMKGELERDVEALGFERTRILRPGFLDGDRVEVRTGERLALRLLRPLAPILPPAVRPVRVEVVARAAIVAALGLAAGVVRYEPAEIFRRGA